MLREHKEELNTILEILGTELDISNEQYQMAIKSYQAVGDWLSKPESKLAKFDPEILPQGSFMLGTMIKPVNDSDDLDVDLVCQLSNKPDEWTQHDLKEAVGNRIKEHGKYREMLESQDGGRRCWTLEYSEDSNYHMDILPSVIGKNFKLDFDRTFNNQEISNIDGLVIRITDNERVDFRTEINLIEWLKSNPYGYAKWFFIKAFINESRMFSLKEAIEPLREFDNNKLPLQRIVQILKRHRDIMFSDSSDYDLDHKPISIIITTLSAQAYDKEDNLIDGLIGVVGRMRGLIKEKWNNETRKTEKWIENPVNEEENFADKWSEEDKKRIYFYEWLDKLEEDISMLINSHGIGLYNLQKSMSNQFGENLINRTFVSYGNKSRILTQKGQRKMASGTGILGTVGTPVPNHNFEGNV